MIKFDNELSVKKAKLAAKRAVLSTVLASSILASAGCSTKEVEEASAIESLDENYDNDLSNTNGINYNKIVSDAYHEGYEQGFYDAEQIQLEQKINDLARDEGQLYVGIQSDDGNLYYSGINSLMCVKEGLNEDSKYYVLECKDKEELSEIESKGKINYLDGNIIDHDLDLSNIIAVNMKDYIDSYYGNDLLESYQNTNSQFSKYESSVFRQDYNYKKANLKNYDEVVAVSKKDASQILDNDSIKDADLLNVYTIESEDSVTNTNYVYGINYNQKETEDINKHAR